MRDHSPALMHRMLVLRQFPLFANAELPELATVAENVVERGFGPGEIVSPAERPTSLHLILDGCIETDHRLGPRDVLGALEVAAHRPARMPAIAVTPARTLELGASDYFELLEDNFGLLIAAIRDLAARVLPLGELRREIAMPFGDPLGLVERMIVLRQHVPFSGARLEALAILAHAATEVHYPADTIVKRAYTFADSALIVLDGRLRAGNRTLGPGHAIGVFETLANAQHVVTIEAATPVRALVCQASTILDVLEDHTDFALSTLETFARALFDHEARIACAEDRTDATAAQDARLTWPHGWRAS